MKTILFACFFLFSGHFLLGQDTNASAIDAKKEAEALIAETIVQNQFTGVGAGFSVDGQIQWEGGAGFQNLENKGAFNANTKTRIASIAKPMTAIAIMQLYEQNKIDLDQPIQQYLPDYPVKNKGTITVRHLLQHASGTRGYQSGKEANNKKNFPTLSDAVGIFKESDLEYEPGTRFSYSTYGYVVLGLIIEKVSGMTYAEYLKKNIWEKAGMSNTGIDVFGENLPNKAALYHRSGKGKIKKAAPSNLSDRIPGGGLYSCVTDILKFGEAILQNKLIKANTLQETLVDSGLKKEGNPYGMGWYLYGVNEKYGEVYGHTGAQTGSSAQFFLLPEQQTTIIVLSNTSGALRSASTLALRLFDISAAW